MKPPTGPLETNNLNYPTGQLLLASGGQNNAAASQQQTTATRQQIGRHSFGSANTPLANGIINTQTPLVMGHQGGQLFPPFAVIGNQQQQKQQQKQQIPLDVIANQELQLLHRQQQQKWPLLAGKAPSLADMQQQMTLAGQQQQPDTAKGPLTATTLNGLDLQPSSNGSSAAATPSPFWHPKAEPSTQSYWLGWQAHSLANGQPQNESAAHSGRSSLLAGSCQLQFPNDQCSGNGHCSQLTGLCACSPGFSGPTCAIGEYPSTNWANYFLISARQRGLEKELIHCRNSSSACLTSFVTLQKNS